jgi:hypothetical protein
MSDEVTNDTGPEQPENPGSIEEMSDEQLDGLLEESPDFVDEDAGDDLLEFGESEEEAPEVPEEEEEADEAEAEEEEAPADETPEEEEAADEDDGMSATTRAQIEEVLQRVEIMEAERERMQAELEREKLLRDRNAGKLGSLMQQLKRSQGDDTADPDDTDEPDEDDAPRRAKSNDPREDELQEIRHERVERAINGSAAEFLQNNDEFFKTLEVEAGSEAAQKFTDDLKVKIREHQDQLGEDIFTMSPKLAKKVARTVMNSAFADLKLDLMREYQKRAAEASEKSRRNIRDRKKGAAGVRSNKRSAVETPTTKPLSKMSDDELEAELAKASFDD